MITSELESSAKITTILWLVEGKSEKVLAGKAFWTYYGKELITIFCSSGNNKISIYYGNEEYFRSEFKYVLDSEGNEIKCQAVTHDEVLHWLKVFEI